MSFFYMSFADPDLPEGTQFLGAAVIEADSLPDAITKSHMMGLNPGGEIVTVEMPHLPEEGAWMLDRLCSEQEIGAHGEYTKGDSPF